METNRITKGIGLIVCCMLLLVFVRVDRAYAITSGNWEYDTYTDTDGTTVACVTKYYGSASTVVVPSSIDGYPVRKLEYTFQGNTSITQCAIPDGVQRLEHTFYQCKNLKKVSLPTSINVYSFTFQESGIETITIPKGTYNQTGTFQDCKSLKHVTIAGTVNLFMDTFTGCENLETVYVETVLPVYGQFHLYQTFAGLKNLQTVTVPDGVTELQGTFKECHSLTTVYLPATVTKIDYASFLDCFVLSDISFAGTECAWNVLMDKYTPGEGDFFISAKKHISGNDGHTFSGWCLDTEATCTKEGKEYRTCKTCDKIETRTVEKLAHTFGDWVVTKEPTASSTGTEERVCTECGYKQTATIAKVDDVTASSSSGETDTTAQTGTSTNKTFKVKLQKSKYTYNGKAQKPKVTAVRVNGKKIAKKYYTVSYKKNKNVGTGKVVVKGKGKYKGYKGTAQFKIILQKAKITKAVSSKAGICTLTWKNDTQAQNFQIQICQSRSFSSGVKTVWGGKKGKKVIKGLTSNKTYYVRIRAYRKVNGAKWYGKWSAVKKVKIK
ncbi:MAG: leucine-rich repeat domain-containing protein [Lachnospiraceae bacterium]|nr:leucine-rich repeat domain-containing protein [Lachnospiraceae bacterium]